MTPQNLLKRPQSIDTHNLTNKHKNSDTNATHCRNTQCKSVTQVNQRIKGYCKKCYAKQYNKRYYEQRVRPLTHQRIEEGLFIKLRRLECDDCGNIFSSLIPRLDAVCSNCNSVHISLAARTLNEILDDLPLQDRITVRAALK